MIDIHCHLLPGIDDGAATIEQSLDLARFAVADGITHMVVTPHIQPGVYENDLKSIKLTFEQFKAALAANDIGLNVAMAAEVRICPEIIYMLDNGDLPLFMDADGKRTVLLELPHSHVPPGTDQMIRWLQGQGIGVLIAHPERNKDLMRKFDLIRKLHDAGCLFQITAGSVAGRFGETPRLIAEKIIRQGWCHLLASDAHNLRNRPPMLSDGLKAAAALIGSQKAEMLVTSNPMQITAGMFA